jgi:hypothetical protein
MTISIFSINSYTINALKASWICLPQIPELYIQPWGVSHNTMAGELIED